MTDERRCTRPVCGAVMVKRYSFAPRPAVVMGGRASLHAAVPAPRETSLIPPMLRLVAPGLLGALVLIITACGVGPGPAVAPEPAPAMEQQGHPPPAPPSVTTPGPTPEPAQATKQPTPPRTTPPSPTPRATSVTLPTSTRALPTTSVVVPTAQAAAPTVERDAPPRTDEIDRLGRAAMETLIFLTTELSPRESASEEERVAAEYLRDEFAALGYDASIQPFAVRTISNYGRLLTIVSPQTLDIRALPIWMTAAGVVTAHVVDVGRALPNDISGGGLADRIALVERGEITFEEKISGVARAGAIGAIVYNNEPGYFVGALEGESIPVVTISQEDGGALKALMKDGPVKVTISLVYTETSQNVIAYKPGTADDGRVVVLGGHYDTVPNVPGANDNGSGIATLLTIAREIADREYPFAVRLVAFGAEELGLYGSRHYVDRLSDDEAASTVAMLNFDALGSGPATAVLGTLSLTRVLNQYGEEHGIDVAMRFSMDWGSSDHAPFEEAGIRHVFFFSDDFSRIHTPEDRLEFVEAELLGTSAFLGMALLDILAGQTE